MMGIVLAIVIPLTAIGLALGIYLLWARWGTKQPVKHDGSGSHWSPFS
ncbi:hypothetical protein JK364_53630 [Streptomyces sp. 110]|uniref:Secreted protein n=1 Tax=Streptomyces endocoffeicus TaxID=2898945 RepID=A0ABS1Q9L7_9ACTN|nr:hypothetical protein [Streptomyces endocoffeicus]MBL1121015.1 hypothetical protein [Streptomyces endocoffeicus]